MRGVGLGKLDAGGKPFPRHRPVGGPQHLVRDVDAEQIGLGIAPRHGDEVARRPTADLQYPSTGRRLQAIDQPVAPQQIVFAAEIVDVTLVTIDAIHQLR